MHREEIFNEIINELRSYPQINLLAEGGAKAFRRYDELSDLDLMVDVEDGKAEETVKQFESFLEKLAGIAAVYAAAENKDFQHKFYKLKNADRFAIIDLFIVERSNPVKELEQQIHGDFVIHYDRYGYMKDQVFDKDAFQKKVDAFGKKSKNVFEFFLFQAEKEILRGRYIDALAYYFDLMLKPLIRLLRIKYNPIHYNFELRYLNDELPAGIVKEIEKLLSIKDPEDLKVKYKMAIELYKKEIANTAL